MYAHSIKVISNLQQYIYLFNENTIKSNLEEGFGKLSLINRSLQSCYLEKSETENLFQSLVNYNADENSRYLFFYANYLIDKKKYLKAKSLFKDNWDYWGDESNG